MRRNFYRGRFGTPKNGKAREVPLKRNGHAGARRTQAHPAVAGQIDVPRGARLAAVAAVPHQLKHGVRLM